MYMLVSFVIPCYNEAKRISGSLDKLFAYFSQWKNAYEIIFVNDGSTDNTANIINTYIKQWEQAKMLSYSPNK